MTKRAVVYARYSTEHERAASIADQVEVCRRYIDRSGWTLTKCYDDAAISGASRHRPGYLSLLADAEAGKFDVLVCEAVDRLGRNLADVAGLYDQLTFARVEIHAVAVGHLTQMHIGFMGTMAQMSLSDTRDKVRRAQLGRARAGRTPAGHAFGYDIVPPPLGAKEAGERRINEAEAEVIRRVLQTYADGLSPRHIAHALNEEGVPGPRGRPWCDTTIRGQVGRGTGLLNNTVYRGELCWDRCSYVKNPKTGKKTARVNPVDRWERTPVPELRIIDDALWEKVKDRQREARQARPGTRAEPGQPNHRQKFLLSGLLTCGSCGGGYTIIGADRYGCATTRSKGTSGNGTCRNRTTITKQAIEARVLGGLKERMLAPDLVAAFVAEFATECGRLNRERAGEDVKLNKERTVVERSLKGIMAAIEGGAWNEILRDRLTELETRRTQIDRDLAATVAPSPVTLHPNAAGLYAARVGELEAALSEPDLLAEATQTIRSLVQQIVLTPDTDAPNSLSVDVHGDLALILNLAAGHPATGRWREPLEGTGNKRHPGTGVLESQLSVVAGIRFELMTFRL